MTASADEKMLLSNKKLVEQFWIFFIDGDLARALALMSDDFTWELTGQTPLSGIYRGKAEVRDVFFAKVAECIDLTAGIDLEIDALIAEGDRVVMLARGEMQGRYGPYNNTYCHVMTVRGGLLCGTVEYVDTELVNRALFAR
ncbi:MAG: nuclear transport factor 2 family protein [Pseudomonadota bacterium]